jgi:hypothetical protein
VEVVEPVGQAYPALQLPPHPAVPKPGASPKVPAGQREHTPRPARLYWPMGQMAAVELVDPAAHAYPAVQSPLHANVVNAGVAPNFPAGQGVHVLEPAVAYVPEGHMDAVDDTEPATQAYPAVQGPTHADVDWPSASPYLPAAHWPVHVARVMPVVLPYKPAGQGVQVPALPVE